MRARRHDHRARQAARGTAADRLPLRLVLAQRASTASRCWCCPRSSSSSPSRLSFLYGLALSFAPKTGDWLQNYRHFFAEPFLYKTIWTTLQLAVPATLVNILLSVPVAHAVRLMRRQRLLTTILVCHHARHGADCRGLLNYLGPQAGSTGWWCCWASAEPAAPGA